MTKTPDKCWEIWWRSVSDGRVGRRHELLTKGHAEREVVGLNATYGDLGVVYQMIEVPAPCTQQNNPQTAEQKLSDLRASGERRERT